MTTDNPRGHIFAVLAPAKLSRAERLDVCSYIAGRPISSLNDLLESELRVVSGTLFAWDSAGHLEAELSQILGSLGKAAS